MEEQKKCTKSFKKEALCYEEHQKCRHFQHLSSGWAGSYHESNPFFYCWYKIFRRRILRRLWFCPESHSRNHYASGLPDLEYKSKRILETAFRFSRPDRRLYRGCFYGKSRSLCYLFRRNHFLPENHAICA